jgi:hypothetical protein
MKITTKIINYLMLNIDIQAEWLGLGLEVISSFHEGGLGRRFGFMKPDL